jgi:hypothetical protein
MRTRFFETSLLVATVCAVLVVIGLKTGIGGTMIASLTRRGR